MNAELLIYFREHTLEFWLLDAKGQPVPFMYEGTNELPLFFHIENDLLTAGAFAKDHWLAGAPNTFGNFYNSLLRDDLFFTRFHKKEPFRKALFFFLKENILPNFVRQQGTAGQTLEDFLSRRPVRLLFDYSLTAQHTEALEETFREVVGVTPEHIFASTYWELLGRLLKAEKKAVATIPLIAVFAAHNDLHFCFLSLSASTVLVREVLAGRGAHPHQDLVSEIVAQKALDKSGSMLTLVQAKGQVMPLANRFLSQLSSGLVEGKVRLSDVGEVHVQFMTSLLQARLDNRASLNLIQSSFDAFRSRNHALESPVFLLGEVLNSESYQQFFRGIYKGVYVEDATLKNRLLLHFFEESKQAVCGNIAVTPGSHTASPTDKPVPPAERRTSIPAPPPAPTPAVSPLVTITPPQFVETSPATKPAVPPVPLVKPPLPAQPVPQKPDLPPPPKRK